MKLDYKKILKVLGTGVGAVAAVKVLQQIVAGLLLDATIKQRVDAAQRTAKAAGSAFDVTKIGLSGDDLRKWVQAQTNGLMAASAIVIFLAQKFLKNADMKTAAWAGAGFPVALGLSALVDKTGKLADMLEFQIVRAPSAAAGASGGTVGGDDDGAVTIPAAALVDFINAKAQAKTMQGGPVQQLADEISGEVDRLAEEILNGDEEDEDEFLAA
jgi:hypothetical protein